MPKLRDFASASVQAAVAHTHDGVVRKIKNNHVIMQVDVDGTRKRYHMSGGVMQYALEAEDMPVLYTVVGDTIIRMDPLTPVLLTTEPHPTGLAEQEVIERQRERNRDLTERNACSGTVYSSKYDDFDHEPSDEDYA